MIPRIPLPAAALLAATILLAASGCASRRPLRVLDRAALSTQTERTIANPRRLLPESRQALDEAGLLELARSSPDEAIRRLDPAIQGPEDYASALAAAELCFEQAFRLRDADHLRAFGYALAASEFASRAVPRTRQVIADDEDALLRAYNFVARRTAEIAHEAARRGETILEVPGPLRPYTFDFSPADSRNLVTVDLATADEVFAEDRIVLDDSGQIFRRTGAGGAVTVYMDKDAVDPEVNPFVSPNGIAIPATALLHFPEPGTAKLMVVDALEESEVEFNGLTIPLAADYSAPFAVLQSKGARNSGWGGLRDPERFSRLRGLYTLQRLGNDRIPLVFVHGLMSTPGTWRQMVNTVFADDYLRDHYQVFLFYYPTGLPIGYNAAQLREALHKLKEAEDRLGPNPNFDRMVVVGHSMGGLLTSAQVRDSGDVAVHLVLKTDLDSARLPKEERERLQEILLFKANPDIERVIYVCAPHRGSQVADGWIGALGSRLIKVPLNLIVSATRLDLEAIGSEFTDLGRTMLTTPSNSVQNLRSDAPVLGALLDMEVSPGVTYHSIMGDRGRPGPVEESSDGIVPYRSAHLDGAVSERMVPAPHSATGHPETIAEIRRILYLHLGRGEPPPLPGAAPGDTGASRPEPGPQRGRRGPPHRRL